MQHASQTPGDESLADAEVEDEDAQDVQAEDAEHAQDVQAEEPDIPLTQTDWDYASYLQHQSAAELDTERQAEEAQSSRFLQQSMDLPPAPSPVLAHATGDTRASRAAERRATVAAQRQKRKADTREAKRQERFNKHSEWGRCSRCTRAPKLYPHLTQSGPRRGTLVLHCGAWWRVGHGNACWFQKPFDTQRLGELDADTRFQWHLLKGTRPS